RFRGKPLLPAPLRIELLDDFAEADGRGRVLDLLLEDHLPLVEVDGDDLAVPQLVAFAGEVAHAVGAEEYRNRLAPIDRDALELDFSDEHARPALRAHALALAGVLDHVDGIDEGVPP